MEATDPRRILHDLHANARLIALLVAIGGGGGEAAGAVIRVRPAIDAA